MEDKKKYKAQRVHTCWNPKRPHLSSELVMKNAGHALFCLGSMLVTVVSETKFFAIFKKIQFLATSKQFQAFKVYIV